MAKYVDLSVATIRGLLVQGWSVNGVWLTHHLDEETGRSRVEIRNVRGVIDSTDAGVTDTQEEKEVAQFVRMQKAAMAVRASQWICPKGTPRLRPTEVRAWRVMSPDERAALVDDWCQAPEFGEVRQMAFFLTDHPAFSMCEVPKC